MNRHYIIGVIAFIMLMIPVIVLSDNDQNSFYDYVSLNESGFFESDRICNDINVLVKDEGNSISVNSNGYVLFIDKQGDSNVSEFIIGDFWKNHRCFIAIRTAYSDVNESYDLYEIHRESEPSKILDFPGIINPDFQENLVISTYRDGARWYKEKVCYSHYINNPYVCEKRVIISENIQRIQIYGENEGDSIYSIIADMEDNIITAKVAVSKSFIMRLSDNDELEKGTSYFVFGDTLKLTDFMYYDGDLYYKFIYDNGGREIIGWIISSDVIFK